MKKLHENKALGGPPEDKDAGVLPFKVNKRLGPMIDLVTGKVITKEDDATPSTLTRRGARAEVRDKDRGARTRSCDA